MSILDELKNKESWLDFYHYKKDRNQLRKDEFQKLEDFIMKEKYLSFNDTFSYPVKKILSKIGSSKKRIVYSYNEDETWMLKLLAFLLYRYDDRLSDNCYSFRRYKTAKTAFDQIRKITDLQQKHILKLDIHDYFNSINVPILLEILKDVIEDDPKLFSFLKQLLNQDRCFYDEELITEKRGAMAGVPLASFFANFYLSDLDAFFASRKIPYFRYSDDILLFTDTLEELFEAEKAIRKHLEEKHLTLNMDKYAILWPGSAFEFLGFRYEKGKISLSEMTVHKMQARIRRKARKLYTWAKRNRISYDKVAAKMIRSFDHRFYDLSGSGDYTWIRFYFPVIDDVSGLKQIDKSMLEYLRYLYSGRHYKGNYAITYDRLKKLGYTPLVAEYYRWKKENRKLNEQNKESRIFSQEDPA